MEVKQGETRECGGVPPKKAQRDGMRYKDMGGGWNAFQTETDRMALECWRPVPPVLSQWNPSCPSKYQLKCSPKRFSYHSQLGWHSSSLPQLLTYSSGSFMILSSFVDIVLKNTH